MSWLAIPGVEIRRRAVVAGRIAAAGAVARGAARRGLALVGSLPERRFPFQLRGGDTFFCLDVPPGRYTIEAVAGVAVKPRRVVVPEYADETRMPVLRLDVEILPPVEPPVARPN